MIGVKCWLIWLKIVFKLAEIEDFRGFEVSVKHIANTDIDFFFCIWSSVAELGRAPESSTVI